MDLIERLRSSPAVKCHRGATEEDIREMLLFARVKLPKDYREFLRGVGWVQVGPNTILGLGPDAFKEANVSEVAHWEHVRAFPPMPHALIPVMNDGSGNHFCLDTSKMKEGRCPIVFWEHDHEDGELQKPKRIKASFEQWLLGIVKAEEDLMS